MHLVGFTIEIQLCNSFLDQKKLRFIIRSLTGTITKY